MQAGASAAAALAYEEAAAHYRRALERFDRRRAAPLRAAAGARRRGGAGRRPARGRDVRPRRRRSPATSFPELFGEAALGGSPGWSQGGAIDRPAIARLEEALAALETTAR